MSVLLIFIDGVGIGARDEHNPFRALDSEDRLPLGIFAGETLPLLPFDGCVIATDACLGVEGRPQSATGQTTILTGINVPQLLAYHKTGFPNERMRELLREHSIFLQLTRAGIAPLAFANAYSPLFFERRPRWLSAATVAVEAARLPFRTLAELRDGSALYHDWSNRILIERGEELPIRNPIEAAAILARLAERHRFTLYEFFLTDIIGHRQDAPAAQRTLAELNLFLHGVLEHTDLQRTTVIVTSDHGNIEDLSVRNHTRNRVPTIVWGEKRGSVCAQIRSIADITPAILRVLTL